MKKEKGRNPKRENTAKEMVKMERYHSGQLEVKNEQEKRVNDVCVAELQLPRKRFEKKVAAKLYEMKMWKNLDLKLLSLINSHKFFTSPQKSAFLPEN